jgi:hypothetical protein
MSATTEHLSSRGVLTLETAMLYLASRVRVHTPLGAGDYLDCVRHHARDNYDRRLRVAVNCMSLYRELFPREYARSPSLPFSITREHEFYRLVHTQCFPLIVDQETSLFAYLEREPRFFLPFIPVRGIQQHDWASEKFDYDELDLPYQLALLMMSGNNQPVHLWDALEMELPAIAPPLAAVGWSLFLHGCRVDNTPLAYLPAAFNLINYQTGNIWLDLPPIGYTGYAWSMKEIARLMLDRMQATKFDIAMRTLHNWFMADPATRLRIAIEVWNDASQKEAESGYAGMMTEDLVDAGWQPLGNDLVAAPPGELERVWGDLLDEADQEQERRELS